MKCFHHDDLDGQASGFCVYDQYHECEMREINYGTPFPFEAIEPNEKIWIVDYSIEPSEMLKLLEITTNVVWIDHHKTALEKYVGFPKEIDGVRSIEDAACILTWRYIYPNKVVPKSINLVADRDIWKWDFGDETKYFFAGSQLYDTSPTSEFWLKYMYQINIDELVEQGKIIEQYKAQEDKLLNKIGFDCVFEGNNCWAVNRPMISSNRIEGRIDNYDIVIFYYNDGSNWTVSLRSNKIDVAFIAKNRGGGGHKSAAGFQCRSLPFDKE